MKQSILIVDDDKTIRESLARYLSHDFRIYQASNGREALYTLRGKEDIVLVLSDLKMPDMDGIELLDNIRNEKKEIKFIFVSSNYNTESISHAFKKGAYDYLSKPTDLDKLIITIKNALKSKSSESKKPVKGL